MSSHHNPITVGLPVYNGAADVEATLQSLLSQSHKNLRILVSDNASNDGTADILRKYAQLDPRVELHEQSENIGAIANFDYVLKNATTEWFMFAAHDDKWSPNYIEALLGVAALHPNAEIVVPQVLFTFEGNTPPIHARLNERVFGMQGVAGTRALLKEAHGSWLYGLHRTSCLSEAFRDAAAFSHVWGKDLVLLLPAILRGRIAGTNEAVFSHLETPSSRIHYRPKTSRAQFQLNRDFRRVAFEMLRREVPGRMNRWVLAPSLFFYCERHGFKWRRAFKSLLKEYFTGCWREA